MKTVDIKGKPYVEVKERIKHFRAEHKGFAIVTEIVSITESRAIFKASISNDKGLIVSTGFAYEDKDSSYINKTSYIENCETSAIGRALGIFGIGIDGGLASADEVRLAIASEKQEKKVEPKQAEPNCGHNQIVEIKKLLATSKIDEKNRKAIEGKLKLKVPFSSVKADECIEYLTKNQ